jgi:hypothetical protein
LGARDGGVDSPSLASTDAEDTDASAEAQPSDAPVNDRPALVDVGAPSGPRCDPTHAWTSPPLRVASVPQASFGRFGGIGVDELTIAWTSTAGTIYVADRSARSDPFGAPSTIDTTSTPVATDRVAIDPTGMVVFAVSADRTKFVAFNRAGVGTTWGATAPLQFVNVNAMASAEQSSQFFDPVLGGDGHSLFYVLASSSGPPILYESKWDAPHDAWTTGAALGNPEFASVITLSPTHATGASSDARTLFFYHGPSGQERAAWRDSATSPFVQFVDIPHILEAAPNFRCDTLYFQGTSSDDAGAFIAQ